MSTIPPQSFTITAKGRLRELKTKIGISHPSTDEKKLPPIIYFIGIWDTGATGSVITRSTAQKLGLSPVSKTVVHHAGGENIVNVYLVNIYLPNHIVIPNVSVTECEDSDQFGVLIGMDVITLGDFSITNLNGETTFSFRIPSIENIDFVKNPDHKKIPVVKTKKIGRNDPCPCGSGKKYKHCCGRKK